MTDETCFTNEEIEHYTARFKIVMDLKQEHYTKKEHQDCRDNFTRRMKQYNERTLANYNLSFDLFCLAVGKDRALKRQFDQINKLKQELEHKTHCFTTTKIAYGIRPGSTPETKCRSASDPRATEVPRRTHARRNVQLYMRTQIEILLHMYSCTLYIAYL